MKTIKKQLKRAFTIVELVIVIAVVAALAAILIPTFVNVVNSANESVDTSLVKNLNTILTSEQILNSGEATTMSEALEWAEANGYSVDKLTPTSTGDILWNQTTNRFVLVNSDGEIIYSDDSTTETLGATYWKIAHAESEVNSKYSTYYAADYVGTVKATISNVGIDVSALTEKVDITYTGDNGTTADTIIINGNGGAFSVNDTNKVDEIKVYNVSASLTGTSLASNSLHLYGTVTGTITISSGRFVLEDTAVINTNAVVIPESATENVVVVNNTSTTVTVFNASNQTVTTSGNVKTSKKSYSDYYAYIDGEYYKTLKEAVSAASSGDTITLLQDLSENFYGINFDKQLTIDFNDFTAKYITNKDTINLSGEDVSLYLKNGTFINETIKASGAVFMIEDGASITLDNMDVTANGSILYPKGTASTVNVYDSVLSTTGTYCVGTNAATKENWNIYINLENSDFTAAASDGDDCCILINVPGYLNINNCTITGDRQGVVVRGGNATIKNTVITCTGNFTGAYYTTAGWGSGNEVPMGALIVGNRSTSYPYTTYCTLQNVTLNASTSSNSNNQLVYMYSSSNYRVDLVYSGCNFSNSDINGKGGTGGCYVNGDGVSVS